MWLLLVILVSGLIISGCVGFGVSQGGWSGVVATGDRLYFGSSEGALVALNSSGGSRLWEVPFETSGGGGLGCAVGSSTVTIYGSPAVDEELVFVSSFDGKVRAINAESGAPRWVYPREGVLHSIISGPLVDQEKVYITTTGGDVLALDAATGDLLWQFENKGEIWAKPVISGDTLFISVFDKKLYALDANTGEEKWAQPFETQGPVVAPPLVYN
ncbi:MAG: PQQ-like beta-propeller repeat protein, partial [Dehalococcoidales bacterium]|nr:PQQ-like beta-propeller repeat protein [Dehalococcoidales bacterium]